MNEDDLYEAVRYLDDETILGIILKAATTSVKEHRGGDFQIDGIYASEMWRTCDRVIQERGRAPLPEFLIFVRDHYNETH